MAPTAASTTGPILIVDDDDSVVASLKLACKQAGLASIGVASPTEALAVLEAQEVALVLQDMNFSRETSGQEGLALLSELRARQPRLPVILMTAWGSIELAVAGMQAGATDFVTKPWDNGQLLRVVRTSLRLAATEERAFSREELDGSGSFDRIVGEHPALLAVLSTVARVAATDAPVLVLGESGTGKELIADAVHANSDRAAGPCVKVNLAGIPPGLFESEMFGHVRGAFTDARSDRTGRFEAAEGGTIFLDEVGDLDRAAQAKLLRVLQDRTFQPVGSSQTRTADFRLVAATNRDLPALVEAGDFREDLYYRLNLITLRLPPLRERRSDIPLIARACLEEVATRYRREAAFAPDVPAWLERRPWPGNVRELRQGVERAVLMGEGVTIERADFDAPGARPPRDPANALDGLTLEQVEKLMVEQALTRHQGNVSQAAQTLGLSRAALYRRMEKFGL